ncbi:rhomboid family intramembrane serine protease [Deminuibacter soli]|uniref:Rhomboid family intramembrane serine protease n=1 Tax=Deminuibacter soli TaxID=2291815 RepID=A0A3E1NIY0_9BACT|nr:rhomboid family intramembrane serine protease [Deminuibacter soli]RFM27887.1 rhomboid family intramembrane serine protease [Deminuibacter soli]
MSITLAIVIITAVISFTAFSNQKIQEDLIFYPPAVDRRRQWYRFITSGFIHANFFHLFFNMWALYSFGTMVEDALNQIFGPAGRIYYLLLYISALVVSLLPTYFNNRDNYHYRSLGASGAVSAVVFAGILFFPLNEIGIFPLPFGIPGFIFGALYLIISSYLSRRGMDNINHSAHLWGSVYGFIYVIAICALFSSYPPIQAFIQQVQSYHFGK